jgi:hypothetical protein
MRSASIRISLAAVSFVFLLTGLSFSEDKKPAGILTAAEAKQVMPSSFFFRGQSASVQLRNAAAFRRADGTLFLAALVDTSGYAADVAAKYQGLLITEFSVDIGGKTLPPGAYGFGFAAANQFFVQDVGAHDQLQVAWQEDAALQRPVPLQLKDTAGVYRLYGGRKWVEIKAH